MDLKEYQVWLRVPLACSLRRPSGRAGSGHRYNTYFVLKSNTELHHPPHSIFHATRPGNPPRLSAVPAQSLQKELPQWQHHGVHALDGRLLRCAHDGHNRACNPLCQLQRHLLGEGRAGAGDASLWVLRKVKQAAAKKQMVSFSQKAGSTSRPCSIACTTAEDGVLGQERLYPSSEGVGACAGQEPRGLLL